VHKRVQYASEQDKEKLERVLGYLKWTEEQVLVLKPCVTGEIVVYMDAAYAIHNDSKSHTGVVLGYEYDTGVRSTVFSAICTCPIYGCGTGVFVVCHAVC
jgi:hypothetical protein